MTTPEIVCVVGSTRFMTQINAVAAREALDGHVVLRPHVVKSRVMHSPWTPEQVAALDRGMHRAVEMADRLLVCNPDGYIGSSTARHIDQAIAAGVAVHFEYPPAAAEGSCLLCAGTGTRVRMTHGDLTVDHVERCPRCAGSGNEPERP